MQKSRQQSSATARLVIANIIFSLLLLEGTLQVVNAVGAVSKNPLVRKIYSYIKPRISMEEWFLWSYMDRGNMIYAGIHQYHPTRGWAMRPSAQFRAKPRVMYSTNAQGYRSLYDYSSQSDKYQIMIVGDSFTFGDEIDDTETWPKLLQDKSPQLNVLNMGGSGYGTDQMLVTLEEEIDKYHPDLVIAAFIDDDLFRSTMPFRDYKKPFFKIENGKLVLHNTPIGNPDEVMQEISQRRYFFRGRIQTINLLNYFLSDLTPLEGSPVCNDACRSINIAIMDRMGDVAKQHGAEFMAVYLPHGKETTTAEYRSYGEDFIEQYRSGENVYILNTRADFLSATFPKAPEHYHRHETYLLADLMLQHIKKTGSWQCKVQQNCGH